MSDQPRCGGCKHWQAFENEWDRVPGWGVCDAVKFFLDENDNHDRMKANEGLALVEDGSGYKAALLSREEFGCVLFEAKAEGA